MSQFSLKNLKEGLSPEEKKLCVRMYWRTLCPSLNMSWSRMMGNGIAFALFPFIEWLYPKEEDKEKKIIALTRHLAFWNCEATTHAFAIGLLASMEKQAAENEDFDVATINAVKASMVGPLSAIGDTIFWITWRVIVTGIALTFALQGNILGPILFILLYNTPKWIARYYFVFLGYKLGTTFLESAAKTGIIDQIIKAATVVGLMMIGGMVAGMVKVPLALTFTMNGIEQPLLNLFDGIVKGFLPLCVFLFLVSLLKKRVNIMVIVFTIMALCVLGKLIGVF